MTFEEWLETVPNLALKEMCIDIEGDISKMSAKQCRKHILNSPESRENAEYSYRVHMAHLARSR